MRDINRQDGIRGLFRGHSATLLRIFPYAGIKFLAYEQLRALIIPSRSSKTPARQFLSGSLAGITSVCFTYPLEVIRVRLAYETKKNPSQTSLTQICRQIYHEQAAKVAASLAGKKVAATHGCVENPVIRSGLVNFYRGFSLTLIGMVPYAGMSFLTHDAMGDLLRHPSVAPFTTLPLSGQDTAAAQSHQSRRPQLTAVAELTAGAVAGLVSQTASYPFEVIRRRMQVGGAVGDGHRLRILETARIVWTEAGWKGFFVGLTIGYLKVVPMVAVSFYVYERSKWWLGIQS